MRGDEGGKAVEVMMEGRETPDEGVGRASALLSER